MKNLSIVTIFTFITLLVISCNDKTENKPIEVLTDINVCTPYQIVTITKHTGFISEKIIAKISDKDVELINTGNGMEFIVPELNNGMYKLQWTDNGTIFFSNITVENKIIQNPEQTIQNTLTSLSAQINYNENQISGFTDANKKIIYTSDLQIIKDYYNIAVEKFSNATTEDKKKIAAFLDANRVWLDSMQNAVTDFTNAAKKINTKGVYDNETDFRIATIRYINAQVQLKKAGYKIIAFTAAGAIIGPVGAAIGLGIGLGNFYLQYQLFSHEMDNLLNFKGIVDDLLTQNKATLLFEVNTEKIIKITGKYINFNQNLISTKQIMLVKIIEAIDSIEKLINEMTSKLNEDFKLKFSVSELLKPETSDYYPVHGKYLTVKNISNSTVTSVTKIIDGDFYINFSSASESDINFTFDLGYSNDGIAAKTITVNATLKVPQTFTDSRDNQKYKWVQIGTQTWMAENLNYKDANSRVYNNDTSYASIYGRLYTWNTAINVCPAGWHLPSKDEWQTLINFAGGNTIAGNALKEAGSLHWSETNSATNSTGFTALPGGNGYSYNSYSSIGSNAFFQTSTSGTSTDMYYIILGAQSQSVDIGAFSNLTTYDYLSVRCVKDMTY